MSIGLLFWVLFVFGVVFYGYGIYQPAWPGTRFGGFLFAVLLGLLGWAVFGPAIHR
jgi:hypothetical protein